MVDRLRELIAAWTRAEFWRANLQTVYYLAFGVILFVVFFTSNFPYGDVLASTFNRFNLAFTFRDQRASPPMGAILTSVRLANPLTPDAPAFLDNVDLRLSPAIGSLLIGRAAIDISAALYGGQLDATVYRRGGLTDVSMDASGLDLGSYDGLVRFGINAAGTVSANGSAVLNADDWTADSGTLELDATDFNLRIARGLPAIRLARITATASLDNSIIKINSLEGSGGDLKLMVAGSIRLGADPSQSFVDLRVIIQPTAAGRARLGILLGMLPHPPGPEPYLIRGPLMAPSIS